MRVDQQLRSFEGQLLEAYPQSPCSRRNRLEAGRTVPVESRFKTFLALVLVVEKFFASIHLKTSPNSTVVEKLIILGLLLETIFFSEYFSSSISGPEILLLLYLVHSHRRVDSTGWSQTAGKSAAWNSQWTRRVAACFQGAWFQSASRLHVEVHTDRIRLHPKGSISALRFDY